MAKKTLNTISQDFDAAQSLQRQLLSMSKDADEIYYRFDLSRNEAETDEQSQTLAVTAKLSPIQPTSPSPPLVLMPSTDSGHGPAAIMEDKPVTAFQIVKAVLCHKLKKQTKEISWDKTIKSLVGGECYLPRTEAQ